MTLQQTRSAATMAAICLAFVSNAATAYITVMKPETCGNSNAELSCNISGSGAVAPYTYLWSNGSTTQMLTGVPGGAYSVTITDAVGTPFTANATVESLSALPFDGDINYYPSYGSFYDITGFTGGACAGQCNGMLSMPMVSLGGTAPFTVDFSVAANYEGLDTYGFPYYSGFCAGEFVTYTITDAFGCQGSGLFTVHTTDETALPSLNGVEGACAGSDIGSISLYQDWGYSRFQLYSNSTGNPIGNEVELVEFTPHEYEDLPPGDYTLQAYPMLGQCLFTPVFNVPDLGPGCTTVEGNAWFDQDGDCVWDGGEVGVPGSVMVIQPGTQYAITGGNGHYSFNLAAGNYTIAQTNPTLVPYCPVTQPVPFTVNGPIANIDWANNSTAPLDLRANINSTWARPGFSHRISGGAANNTVQATGAVEVIMTIDPTLDFVSATPTPTSTAGNVFTWQIAELDYFGAQGFIIWTTVPVGTPLGTVLNHSISVSSANTDTYVANNTDSETRVVSGSYDPNDKTAATSSHLSDALYFINEDEWIDYTIRFQNTGTAEAFFITITDTLPEELDMTTFQMALASHAHTYTFKPGRVVEWFFDAINLPDSTTDLAGSQGFLKFRIKPVQPLLAGTVLTNTANIYFDFNEAVITEPSVLVAEFSTGVEEVSTTNLRLSPVPVIDQLNIASSNEIRSVRIVAADGRDVAQRTVWASVASIDVSMLNAGAYLLIATMIDGSAVRERFLKP
ncbi:MAG: hypothetical protein IPM12_09525 [Flavobacteriales bacterium]|nr:hypothetical protein [Flavobacteriales bacterium]